jgi:thioredoxin-related protein
MNDRPEETSMRILMIMILGLFATLAWPAAPPAQGAFYGGVTTEYPAWFKNSFLSLKEDVDEAKASGRRVILLFTQDNCPYCHLLVERNLSQRDIEATLKSRFDVIQINLWGDREVTGLDGVTRTEKNFAAALKVQFTPTILFLDETGQTVLRLNGYTPPARFKAALDWAADHGEAKQPFRDFVAAREQSAKDTGGELIAEGFFKPLTDLRRKGKNARPLAVFFEQKDCPDCAALHTRILADPDVRRELARFDAVQLDMWARRTPITTPDGKKLMVMDWAKQLDVKYAPAIVLIDATGHEVLRWEAGFRVFHTAGMLDYVASGAYRTEPNFQRFLTGRADRIRETGRSVNIWRYADEPEKPQ